MLDPKLRIPRIMVSGLVLGGAIAGCGGDDTSGVDGGGGSLDAGGGGFDAVSEWCMASEACDPAEFESDFGTQAACREFFNEDLSASEVECREAVLAYYECAAPILAETCMPVPECAGLLAASNQACD